MGRYPRNADSRRGEKLHVQGGAKLSDGKLRVKRIDKAFVPVAMLRYHAREPNLRTLA